MPELSLGLPPNIVAADAQRNPVPGAETRLGQLLDGSVRTGRVDWIGLRTSRRGRVQEPDEAVLERTTGVVGDHYAGRSGIRQVSLIGRENLAAIASFLGRDNVPPALLRRNFVIFGVNLLALKNCRFRLGAALLQYTGECQPCSRMEQLLGPGGYNAVRGQGGVLAHVLEPGRVRLGDALVRGERC